MPFDSNNENQTGAVCGGLPVGLQAPAPYGRPHLTRRSGITAA